MGQHLTITVNQVGKQALLKNIDCQYFQTTFHNYVIREKMIEGSNFEHEKGIDMQLYNCQFSKRKYIEMTFKNHVCLRARAADT